MTFYGELHPYQVEAAERMKERRRLLLAYGQGLGKTPITLSVIEDLFETEDIIEPGLIICPSGLKYQWAQSIEKFTDSRCVVVDGTRKTRTAQYDEAQTWAYDYVICSFEQVVNDWTQIVGLPRGFVVCDEVSFIKGFRAKRSKLVKQLRSHYRFGLTGTPIENGKPEEVFSIMQWIDPEVFGRFDLFDQTFIVRNANGWPVRYRNIPTFLNRLGTAMVRKTMRDPDVAPYMPEDDVRDPILIPLDKPNKHAYRLICEALLQDLDEAALSFGSSWSLDAHYGQSASDRESALRGRIGSKMLALQMLVDHPELLRISAARYDESQRTGRDAGGSAYAAALRDLGHLDVLRASPKLNHLVAYVESALSVDHRSKVVVFTQFATMVPIIEKALSRWGTTTYTGALNAKAKHASKTLFQTDPKIRVLVSSDAGGFGVDLPQANHLVNYDLPDRAGLADQRDTRIVRASSEFDRVTIVSLLAKGSLEERKHQVLEQKRAVAGAFIDGRGINAKAGVDLDVASVTRAVRELLSGVEY